MVTSFMGLLLQPLNGAEIMNYVWKFFQKISSVFADLWFWPVIFLGLLFLAIITMSFLVKFSYENRILKSINKLNKYFLAKPYITDENLVEFNLKMKKVPKVLRNNWQIYMLNREDGPTKYINVNSCIDKPLRTSSIEKNMSNFSVFTFMISFIAFVVGLQFAGLLGKTNTPETLFFASFLPLLIVIFYSIFIFIIRAAKNDIYACLYENFPLYERNLTKAVSTLPAYVDYEILFTKKEIKEGIPILQQYLEKRALIEQQELEKARENSEAVQEYDFDDLGIDASLVLERAMKESETFLKVRNRLMEESGSIETEKDNFKKTYETTSKDLQRKLQASRENMESLKSQQESSTNRIESNYIRKQQADEIKKQQQIEKDIEETTAKFKDEQKKLQKEIDKREKDIEEKRQFVEKAMLLEFKHYANSLYKALTQKATEVGNQKLLALAQENSDLKALLTDLQGVGSSPEQLDPKGNLIQNQEVTSATLYEMADNDENVNISVNGETGEVSQQESSAEVPQDKDKNKVDKGSSNDGADDGGKQMQEQPQTQEQIIEENAQSNMPQDENSAQQNVQYDENSAQQNVQYDENSAQQNVQYDENSQQQYDVNTEQQYDEGVQQQYDENAQQQYDANAQQQYDVNAQQQYAQPSDYQTEQYQVQDNNQSNTSDDLDQIQKQIEDEANKLQANRQEFENDLNNTISKMDEQQSVQNEEPQQVAQVNPEPEPQIAPVQQETPQVQAEVTPQPQETPVQINEAPKPVRESRRVSRKVEKPEKKSSVRGRRSRSSSKSSSGDVNSELDSLNAEMQKLLDSTK